jgi:predicted Zn finger-like uncharacterized protein
MPGEIRSVVLKCPECGAEVHILADGIPNTTRVSCSRCGHELGAWGDIDDEGRIRRVPLPPAKASRPIVRGNDPPAGAWIGILLADPSLG